MQTEEELIIIYSGYKRKTFVYKSGRSVSVADADLDERDVQAWEQAEKLLNGIANRHDE